LSTLIITIPPAAEAGRSGSNKIRGKFYGAYQIVCAIILPPFGVFLQAGIGKHFWINIVLTILGYILGIVHAIWGDAKNK